MDPHSIGTLDPNPHLIFRPNPDPQTNECGSETLHFLGVHSLGATALSAFALIFLDR
jgi:hypothetical protein